MRPKRFKTLVIDDNGKSRNKLRYLTVTKECWNLEKEKEKRIRNIERCINIYKQKEKCRNRETE
jgi:hypothetical protein